MPRKIRPFDSKVIYNSYFVSGTKYPDEPKYPRMTVRNLKIILRLLRHIFYRSINTFFVIQKPDITLPPQPPPENSIITISDKAMKKALTQLNHHFWVNFRKKTHASKIFHCEKTQSVCYSQSEFYAVWLYRVFFLARRIET